MKLIQAELQKSQVLINTMLASESLLETTAAIAKCCEQALRNQGKILLAGNGGSAADSQHLAAELVGRLTYDRPALAALALTTDTSALTAIGNDYSFEHLFSRQLEALGRPKDVFIGISTSGKSPNILKALQVARSLGLVTIGFSGQSSPLMAQCCDWVLNIPSTETAKIQEGHITMGHIICALIQQALFAQADQHASKNSVEVV